MRACVAILAVWLLAAVAPAAASARGCPAGTLKPTLVSEVPSELGVYAPTEDVWYVIFRAGMRNEGKGPLTITGRRKRAGQPMRSRQVLDCARRRPARRNVNGVGSMSYSRQPTHEHFHLRDIERYRLVSLSTGLSHRSYKRGFCLGDSFDPGIAIANKPAVGGFDGDLASACGQGESGALRIREGLSVGWGDYYSPLVEGQYVDLTELPAGNYRLLTELDPFKRLTVGSRARAVGGVDFRLSWPDGADNAPEIDVKGSCNTVSACGSAAPVQYAPAQGSAALGRPQPSLGGRLASLPSPALRQ